MVEAGPPSYVSRFINPTVTLDLYINLATFFLALSLRLPHYSTI